MKKVGIITIVDYKNYGNRLQNYALQEVIKSFDLHVETIVNSPFEKKNTSENIFKRILNSRKRFLKKGIFLKILNRLKYEINKEKINYLQQERIKVFKNFTKKNIIETNFKIRPENIETNLLSGYDFFVTGSDQVWNPNFRKGSSIDFLTFTSKKKRVAYAPSFGISEIPKEYIENYQYWISNIPNLSVREKAGAKIIKNLTGQEVEVLVDPTLLLTKEKWLSISKKSLSKPKKEYLLTYFLGSITKDHEKKIKDIAYEKNLEIINLADLKAVKIYTVDPSEFIDFINSASIFYTDSFHGVVFSILLETPFVVLERGGTGPSMNSRIENLLSLFELESRLFNNLTNENGLFEVDFSKVNQTLERERKRSFKFLRAAFNIG